jgi:4-hydroxybenzoate polyprenyltransferase
MKKLKIFIELTRLNKPIGYMLLFWPCAWGLAYAYIVDQNLNKFLYYLLLFFLGSILMRSAGCIVNDIVDKDIDTKVQRTKNRPLASNSISVMQAMSYIFLLCGFAFLILVQFNNLTIALGISSMILAFSYPYMKRITYWPQLFLGLTFNWGIIMAWTSITGDISIEIIVLYVSAIFWTLGYDTIYGAQDIVDDEIIGMKSTSIKFKNNIKLFVSFCYLISSILIVCLFYDKIGLNNFTLLIITFILSLMYQVVKFKKDDPKKCLQAFKFNNISGLLLFSGIILIN